MDHPMVIVYRTGVAVVLMHLKRSCDSAIVAALSLRREEGATLVEYALVTAAMATMAVAVACQGIGTIVYGFFLSVSNAFPH